MTTKTESKPKASRPSPGRRLLKGQVLSVCEGKFHRVEVREGCWLAVAGSKSKCLVISQTRVYTEGREGKTFEMAIEPEGLPRVIDGLQKGLSYFDSPGELEACSDD